MKKHILSVLRGEFIGKQAVVLDKHTGKEKAKGIIINETKHLLTLDTKKGYKKVQKASSLIHMDKLEIDGKLIEMAPEDRIRIKVKA